MWSDCRAARRALSVLVNELVKPPGFPWISSLTLLSRDAATSKPWPMHPCKPQRHHDLFFVWNVLPSTHISAHPSIRPSTGHRLRGHFRLKGISITHPPVHPSVPPFIHAQLLFAEELATAQPSVHPYIPAPPVSGSFLKTVLPPIRPSF